jgi:hypothetical protein
MDLSYKDLRNPRSSDEIRPLSFFDWRKNKVPLAFTPVFVYIRRALPDGKRLSCLVAEVKEVGRA